MAFFLLCHFTEKLLDRKSPRLYLIIDEFLVVTITSKHFASINSFNPHIKLIRRNYFISLLQMKTLDTERWVIFQRCSKKVVEIDPILWLTILWFLSKYHFGNIISTLRRKRNQFEYRISISRSPIYLINDSLQKSLEIFQKRAGRFLPSYIDYERRRSMNILTIKSRRNQWEVTFRVLMGIGNCSRSMMKSR